MDCEPNRVDFNPRACFQNYRTHHFGFSLVDIPITDVLLRDFFCWWQLGIRVLVLSFLEMTFITLRMYCIATHVENFSFGQHFFISSLKNSFRFALHCGVLKQLL